MMPVLCRGFTIFLPYLYNQWWITKAGIASSCILFILVTSLIGRFCECCVGGYRMDHPKQEEERALLDLDGLTVLQIPRPEDPFQDTVRGAVNEEEEDIPVVGPDEWLED